MGTLHPSYTPVGSEYFTTYKCPGDNHGALFGTFWNMAYWANNWPFVRFWFVAWAASIDFWTYIVVGSWDRVGCSWTRLAPGTTFLSRTEPSLSILVSFLGHASWKDWTIPTWIGLIPRIMLLSGTGFPEPELDIVPGSWSIAELNYIYNITPQSGLEFDRVLLSPPPKSGLNWIRSKVAAFLPLNPD